MFSTTRSQNTVCIYQFHNSQEEAIIFTCEITMNNLTCEITIFISGRNFYKTLYFI